MNPLPDFVTQARQAAQQSASMAGNFASRAFTIPDEIRRYAQEALDYNKDLIGLRSGAFKDFITSPEVATEKFGVQNLSQDQGGGTNPNFVFNPFTRNRLISDFVGNQQLPFNLYNSLLGQREGDIGSLVEKGTRSFQAASAAEEAKTKIAQDAYSNILKEFQLSEDTRLKEKELAISASKAGSESTTNLQVIEDFDKFGNPVKKIFNPKTGQISSPTGGAQYKAPTGALVKQMSEQGYDWNPSSQSWVKKKEGLDWLISKIGGLNLFKQGTPGTARDPLGIR